jgi:hypothetical protein
MQVGFSSGRLLILRRIPLRKTPPVAKTLSAARSHRRRTQSIEMQPWPPDLKIYEDLAERLLHRNGT